MAPTAAITTLGCKVNQAESESIAASLAARGFNLVDVGDRADVYIVNSCTVTAEADHKSRRLARSALRRNGEALVVLTGCYASEVSNRRVELPQQILLVPTAEKDEIADIVTRRVGVAVEQSAGVPHGPAEGCGRRLAGARTRVMAKVQDGCDNYCAYCVVPLARGGPRSTPVSQVTREVAALADRGVGEVVLTGINLGAYSSDGVDMVVLLTGVLGTGVGRVRLSSIEPQHVTDRLIDILGREERLCPHLHIPLQSGSDAVLARMGRAYTARDFRMLIDRAKTARPDLALTTDVIVGFPGETDDDLERTVSLLEDVVPLKSHVFKYSSRPRTAAADMAGQIDPIVKSERARRLGALERRLGERFVENLVGSEQEVLVESVGTEAIDGEVDEGEIATGLAPDYVRCFFKGDASLRGTIVRIATTRQDGRTLIGRLPGTY